jgi:hypothetical protein
MQLFFCPKKSLGINCKLAYRKEDNKFTNKNYLKENIYRRLNKNTKFSKED